MTPVFGQGANSALESCRILDDVLSASVDKATGKVRAGLMPTVFAATEGRGEGGEGLIG